MNSWNINILEYTFTEPYWLILLIALPFIFWRFYKKERNRGGDIENTTQDDQQDGLGENWIVNLRHLCISAFTLGLGLLILAMAKPFSWNLHDENTNDYVDGIDIMIAMDVSGSMMAMDFLPNRLEASKKVAKDFIDGRHGDRIGLVVYAGEAYTACPATLDYDVLKKQIDQVNDARISGGTAIGTGLGIAVTRLKSDSLASKVVILLTDGSNNAGEISPLMAAELAKSKNIRVYTIGMGSRGMAKSPVMTPFGIQYQNMPVEIDEKTLKEIAHTTGGEYFRATNEKGLAEIYKAIEKLEKRKMEDNHFKSEPPANPVAFLRWGILLTVLPWLTMSLLFTNNEY